MWLAMVVVGNKKGRGNSPRIWTTSAPSIRGADVTEKADGCQRSFMIELILSFDDVQVQVDCMD